MPTSNSSNMDVASARVDTIDEALAVIRQAVASTS
jgi:hypothetical protein